MQQQQNQQEEVLEEQQEVNAETAEANEQAGFASSFGEEVRADEAPADSEPEQEQQEEQGEDGEAEEEAGLTAEELTAMLAKIPKIDEVEQATAAEIRKLHGKLGEFNRHLQELKTARTGAGKLDASKLKRLNEDYPELAQILADDLNEAGFDTTSQQPAIDYSQQMAQVKEEMYKDMQKNLLLIQHQDVFDVVATDEYRVWKQTQPAELQQQLDTSFDAMFLGKQITAFKEWRSKKSTGTQQRQTILERALNPKGAQPKAKSVALSELDGFMAAFKT